MNLVMNSITISIKIINIVSSGLFISMAIKVAVMVIALDISWVMPWLIASRTVSTSLVKRLIISPWVCVSKYFMGRSSRRLNKSLLMLFKALLDMRIIRNCWK